MMARIGLPLFLLTLIGALMLVSAPCAFAEDEVTESAPVEADAAAAETTETADEPGRTPPTPWQIVAIVLLVLVLLVATGCFLAVFRVIFPVPTELADVAVRNLGTGRLLVTGLLPVVGAGLLGAAAAATGPVGGAIWGVLIGLPALILMLVGAAAAVPYLGAAVLRGGSERSPLTQVVVGAVVLGLAIGAGFASHVLAPFVLVVVFGWFLGAGLGVVFRPAPAVDAAPEENAS
jgi:hypothetical protein